MTFHAIALTLNRRGRRGRGGYTEKGKAKAKPLLTKKDTMEHGGTKENRKAVQPRIQNRGEPRHSGENAFQ
jgi:hypothetical protein